jgi:ribosome-associated translation inhibitor RaiA
MEEKGDLHIEFHSEEGLLEENHRDEVRRRLRKLAKGHTDITGAAVAVEVIAQGENPFLYRVRVVAYVRPDPLSAEEKSGTVRGALKGALTALERQVRERRDKLGRPWEKPS